MRGHENKLELAGAVDERNDLYCNLWKATREAIYSVLEAEQRPGCQGDQTPVPEAAVSGAINN